jgi:RNA polymerase sigma-70 factor (ECF subfamily)
VRRSLHILVKESYAPQCPRIPISPRSTTARSPAVSPRPAPRPIRPPKQSFYRRLAPRVRLYGLRHLRDRHAAADLVQQVLLMTLERLRAGKVREPERIASFVLGTAA